ncbi:hypothetical protein C8R43DRAFT_1133851 [Mycena crocata]|nr:hypothetical protein C8R43DRAFT_1133851 [Mycena crocata]
MATEILPFHDANDVEYVSGKTPKPVHSTPRFLYFCRFTLYQQILEAQARQEKSLADLPTELLISILSISAASSRKASRTLALTSPWISDITLPIRLEHISIRTVRQLTSFNDLVCTSPRAADAVRTLWLGFSHAERTFIPDTLRACRNLRAFSCQLVALESLCAAMWPQAPRTLTLLDAMQERWPEPDNPMWVRILHSPHGPPLLHTLTHLHLVEFHPALDEFFPAAHLPCLTHFAMGSEKNVPWAHVGPGYDSFISSFARDIRPLSLRLEAAVLVLWPFARHWELRKGPLEPWHTPELVRLAREADIMIYCVANGAHEELKYHQTFWEEAVNGGDDIWSLARKQMESRIDTGHYTNSSVKTSKQVLRASKYR